MNEVINKQIVGDIKNIIANAHEKAVRSIDFERLMMYWHIGQRIFEEEQQGKDRADYGSKLIQYVSAQLEPEYGSGFGKRHLEQMRQFYRTFPIANALRSQLNWTQYRTLIRIENEDKRAYYIAEATKNNWNSRQLERQINSQLYERLLLSSDKVSVMAIANNEKLLLPSAVT